jgi:hypothetical protein
MNRPDFYPEGRPDSVLTYEWGLFRDPVAARKQLDAWGYRDGFISMLQAPDYYLRQQTHLFDGSLGARGMYERLVDRATKLGLTTVETRDGLGDHWAVFEFHGADTLKAVQSGYRVVLQRANLVAMVDIIGAKAVVTVELAVRVGRTFDDRARDREPYLGPTPAATPVAPARWVDRVGRPVPADVIRESLGPEHCEWQSVVFLTVGGNVYISDSSGLSNEVSPRGVERVGTLPAGAADTLLRSGDRQLWLGADDDGAYIVTPGGIERWPRFTLACF